MQLTSVFTTLAVLAAAGTVMGERHTVTLVNRCGRGTPQLIRGPNVLSSGGSYTENGVLSSAIAYLQTGNCLFNGENCMTAELTLKNPDPSQPGSGSSVNLSLIPPHAFNVAIGLKYTGSCSNGVTCANANCPTTDAFRVPSDTQAQRACQNNDVNLEITFCP
ncbi:hypothetical protein PQX77_005533 [Marasmius sp. AFHP31]|nr:hypothetical protein PQX77_005533 [Marasmius sp. AFHP31]